MGGRRSALGAQRKSPSQTGGKAVGLWRSQGGTAATEEAVQVAARHVGSGLLPFCDGLQMRWTRCGAHLLLQTRTRALDGTLRPMFERWYPGLVNDNQVGNRSESRSVNT